jgi:hypothetical protein
VAGTNPSRETAAVTAEFGQFWASTRDDRGDHAQITGIAAAQAGYELLSALAAAKNGR